jgi:uncharacterized membrane protein
VSQTICLTNINRRARLDRSTSCGAPPSQTLLWLSIRRPHTWRTIGVTAVLLALGLGFVSGLRTFTPVAAVLLVRGGIWGIVLAVAAVGEYVWDVLPNTPSRTQAMGLSARVISGAFVGWLIATMHDGSGMFGAIAGIAGAVIGTYAGHAARLAAIARIGGYPAAIVEDLLAIGLAAFIVTR